MHIWTIVFAFLAVASASVQCASLPTIIKYYDENSEPQNRPVRTPLRIVAEPVKSRGSITYYNNEIDQQPKPTPQRLSPVASSRLQKVTRIHKVPDHYQEEDVSLVDPIKLSLAGSPLRLLPLLPTHSRTTLQGDKKYFGTSNFVDEYVEPIKIKVADNARPTGPVAGAPAVHYNYETSFGHAEWPINSKIPIIKKAAIITKSEFKVGSNEHGKLTIDKLAKLDKYRLRSTESSSDSNESSSSSSSSSSEEDDDSSSSEEDSSEENNGAKEISDEEAEKNLPINYYSQIRNQDTRKYLPAPQNDLRINEKISTKKSGIVYSEQGYNDKSYDHKGTSKLYEVHQRYRRSNSNVETLPIPTEKVTSGVKLNGEELLKYIQDLINNSSKYLPESNNDDSDDDINSINSFLLNSTEIMKLFALPVPLPDATATKPSTEKYPFLHIPVSALRYAESFNNFPKKGEFYYNNKITPCPDIDSIDESKVPSGDGRFKDLGRKIDCLQKRNFDADTLDNPLFKEELVNPSFNGQRGEITPKLLRSLNYLPNPSVNVYDDVISNIRSAIVAEHSHIKDRNQIEILKLKAKVADSEFSESSNVNQTVVRIAKDTTKDGIFDISKYLPRTNYEAADGLKHVKRYKKKKRRKNTAINSSKFRHNIYHKDYTVFPDLTPPAYLDSETAPNHVNHRKKLFRSRNSPINPSSQSSSGIPTSLSSGYYPYPVLAAKKKRFHYELLRNAH